MFKQNKYKKWHDSIITKAKNRKLFGYKETHHILPKSLGGSNELDNLVELTAREHFLVHLLLCKFTIGVARQKMGFAFHAMCTFKNKGRYRKINSKVVANIRANLKMTEEHKQNISKAMKGNPKIVGKKLTEEHKQKVRLAKLGHQDNLGWKHTEKSKRKIGLKSKGNKHFLGKRYLNKDNKNLVIDNSEVDKYLKMGYKLGMCPKNYTDKWYNRKVA